MNCYRCSFWLLTLPLLLLAGCQGSDDITRSHPTRVKPREKDRLLGTIIPQPEGANWFFKFVAPVSVVEDHEKAFSELIRSIKLENKAGAIPTWKLPDGWEEEKGQGLRHATLRFGTDNLLELRVSTAQGTLLANVNRWLGEMGRPEAKSEKELREEKLVKDVDVNGRKVFLVDIIGQIPKGKRPMVGKPGQRPALGVALEEPEYVVPDGWKQVDPADDVSRIGFRLPDSPDNKPEVKISVLPGDGGDSLKNYQRLEDQVGLKPSAKLPGDLKTITVNGKDATYIDLLGPEGKDQKHILVVVYRHGDFTWVFKLWASAERVKKYRKAFEALVNSVHF